MTTEPINDSAGELGDNDASKSAEVIDVKISSQELRTPVSPQKEYQPLSQRKESHAYQIVRGLFVGLGVLTLFVLVMLCRATFPVFNEDSVNTWVGIFERLKEIATFVLGAAIGHWLSSNKGASDQG